MSGYELVLGHCWACHRPFTFNADRVPSIPIDPATNLPPDLGGDPERAQREPVCEDCIGRVNARRRASGLAEIHVLPGAYDARPA